MFDIASASALFTTALGNVGSIIGTVLSAVLVIWAGLLGLGFGLSRVRRYITKRKA